MSDKQLLCDFHIHSCNSDGDQPILDIVHLYGMNGFDVIAFTDHFPDSETAKRIEALGVEFPTLREEELESYFEKLREAGEVAEEQYGMLVIPGIEVTNNTEKFHILALGVEERIDPDKRPEEIIEEIKSKGGVAVACHPADDVTESRHRGNTYLWDNFEELKDKFDAWEVGNRDDLFPNIGRKKVNFVANSDMHRKEHLSSWKTVVEAEKNVESVKESIRKGRTSITYFDI